MLQMRDRVNNITSDVCAVRFMTHHETTIVAGKIDLPDNSESRDFSCEQGVIDILC